ncbi:ABC transporter permease [Myxococcota bacterium]|nr:ABC transporter permease [Myxococcota bacterium]MBU1430181.1 ABC transporter permease [Myxococcota bacterium]MBU1898595.1 ABC transporter permease [Myxococcota bacterium]
MTLTALSALVAQNISRSKKNFFMSGIGIVVGISTFVFFLGLGEGIKEVVLGRIFLVDQVEVVRKKFDTGLTQGEDLFGIAGSRQLDDSAVADFKALQGVRAVYPKMKFTFPTRGYGGEQLFGKEVWAEIIADGIEPALVADELAASSGFKDWEAPISCKADAGCPDGRTCDAGECKKLPCLYEEKTRLTSCPGESYCAADTDHCETPIPVIVSHHLLELYNGSLATALSSGNRKMPKISKQTILGFQLNVTLGKSFLGRAAKKGRYLTRRLKLVGFSDKAITVGVTMPLEYVRRLNARYSGEVAAERYHSIIIKVQEQTQVPQIIAAVKDLGFELAENTDNAERAAKIIKTVESVFALVSFIIVGIAAINISQMFFMIIYQRKREIGLLRALGANRGHIRAVILGEAAMIGVAGGALGCGVGYGASRLADWVANQLPRFPYKPDTFFAFPLWLWAAAISGAVLFCLIGAFFPANTAARQEPAAALTQ